MTDVSSLEFILEWEVIKNTGSTRAWVELLRALEFQHNEDLVGKANNVCLMYERAVRAIPQSFKLWKLYIKYRVENTESLCSRNDWFLSVREVFERALEKLPIMPALWISYIEFVTRFPLPKVTITRHLISRALTALPTTQHHLVWPVVKTWTYSTPIPAPTLRRIWHSYLLFNTTTSAKREYLNLLLSRKDYDTFVQECVRFRSEALLTADMVFWEDLSTVLRAKEWSYSGNIADLEDLVHQGRTQSASATQLVVSLALFLIGQGYLSEGRRCFSQLLQEAPEVESFLLTFSTAVEVESQLVESFVADSGALAGEEGSRAALVESIFGSADPLTPLSSLMNDFPLLFNLAQLNQRPLDTALWLKRIEIERDRAIENKQTEPIRSLFRTAITRCTSNFYTVDPSAGELFHSFARECMRTGEVDAAVEILEEGGWSVPFASLSVNLELLGFLAELKVLTAETESSVASYFIKKLTSSSSSSSPSSSKRERNAFFSGRQPLATVKEDSRTWILVLDILLSLNCEAETEVFLQHLLKANVLNAEGATYVAHRFYKEGNQECVFQVLERALECAQGSALPYLFLTSQYFSYLILWRRMSIHRFRERYWSSEEVMLQALREDPYFTVSFFMHCAAFESIAGLNGNAERIVGKLTSAVVTHLDTSYEALVNGVVEVALGLTFKNRGIQGVREWGKQLLQRREEPRFIERVAVQWASLEHRTHQTANAKSILKACSATQHPAIATGFWECWESLCTSVDELEGVARIKLQVQREMREEEEAKTE